MKTTKPTALQLAQLAAALRPAEGKERASIRQAATLIKEAQLELKQADERAEYLRNMVRAIYDADPREWQQWIDGYPGDKADVDAELSKTVSADAVRKQLWKDKNKTTADRRSDFLLLANYARNKDLPPPPSRNARDWPKEILPWPGGEKHPSFGVQTKIAMASYREDLSRELISLRVVRWAVDVRRIQLKEKRSRLIPASSKENKQQDHDIQHKPAHRE